MMLTQSTTLSVVLQERIHYSPLMRLVLDQSAAVRLFSSRWLLIFVDNFKACAFSHLCNFEISMNEPLTNCFQFIYSFYFSPSPISHCRRRQPVTQFYIVVVVAVACFDHQFNTKFQLHAQLESSFFTQCLFAHFVAPTTNPIISLRAFVHILPTLLNYQRLFLMHFFHIFPQIHNVTSEGVNRLLQLLPSALKIGLAPSSGQPRIADMEPSTGEQSLLSSSSGSGDRRRRKKAKKLDPPLPCATCGQTFDRRRQWYEHQLHSGHFQAQQQQQQHAACWWWGCVWCCWRFDCGQTESAACKWSSSKNSHGNW
ncbi:hypothetical protein D917_03981 [Trichinella nativa]|uniref:C2H2-type domain-containing protein n=1 Tax=Trichinella nativa TaxID=6335 RepID=A0A1Y3EBP4_9BILA|nr:hypothetical protein D917_03981 [Trichinella nativa]